MTFMVCRNNPNEFEECSDIVQVVHALRQISVFNKINTNVQRFKVNKFLSSGWKKAATDNANRAQQFLYDHQPSVTSRCDPSSVPEIQVSQKVWVKKYTLFFWSADAAWTLKDLFFSSNCMTRLACTWFVALFALLKRSPFIVWD